jgi:hypothetical protein
LYPPVTGSFGGTQVMLCYRDVQHLQGMHVPAHSTASHYSYLDFDCSPILRRNSFTNFKRPIVSVDSTTVMLTWRMRSPTRRCCMHLGTVSATFAIDTTTVHLSSPKQSKQCPRTRNLLASVCRKRLVAFAVGMQRAVAECSL